MANSRELQKIIVTKELIHSFKNLIRYDGPAARFLAFFHAICSCQGEAVLANQNLCLSELVLNQDDYSLLMVQFLEGPAASRGSPASMGFINVSPCPHNIVCCSYTYTFTHTHTHNSAHSPSYSHSYSYSYLQSHSHTFSPSYVQPINYLCVVPL